MCKLLLVFVSGCLVLTTAFADSSDKKTILTTNGPILVPGATLQPGRYVVKLVDSPSNRHIVRIFNETEDQVLTTILAIPNWRLTPASETQFTFWETPAGNPPAIRAWFYPGDNFGQEFVYPKGLAVKIATKVTEPVPAYEPVVESELATVPVTTVEPPAQPVEIAQAPKKPAETAISPARPPDMPKTASFAPAMLLAGMAAFIVGVALRRATRLR